MDHLWTPWRYAYVAAEEKSAKPGVAEALSAWPGDHHCVFCNMLAAVDYAIEHGMSREEAEASAYILERGPSTFLVLNAYPYNSGHLMAVPYRHESSLTALPIDVAEELMKQARRMERLLRAVYSPDGLNMGLNLGESAGAGVAHHLHMHAVPRWAGDTNFISVIGETRVLPETLSDTWRRLRTALGSDPLEQAAGDRSAV